MITDKKYYWFGLGTLAVVLIAFFAINNLLDTSNLKGNLGEVLGTPEEYSQLTTEIDTKLSSVSADLDVLSSTVTLAAHVTQVEQLRAQLSTTQSEYRSLISGTTPSDGEYLRINEALNSYLATLENLENEIENIQHDIGVPSGDDLICPYDSESSANFEEADNFRNLYVNVRRGLSGLSSLTTYTTSEESLIDALMIDLGVLIDEYDENSNNCFALGDSANVESGLSTFFESDIDEKIRAVNFAIGLFNDGPAVCARAMTCTDIRDLDQLEEPVICASGTSLNTTTNRCEASAPTAPATCQYSSTFQKFDSVYYQMASFVNNPTGFDQTQGNVFFTNLTAAIAGLSSTQQAAFNPFMSAFDYETQANQLVTVMNSTKQLLAAENPVCTNTNYANLAIVNPTSTVTPTNTTNNTPSTPASNICPTGATYDTGISHCVCTSDLTIVDSTGTCLAATSTNNTTTDETVVPDGTTTTSSTFTCSDGRVVSDILECLSSSDSDTVIGDTSNSEATDNLHGSGDESDGLSLTTNTNANVMMSGAVQGETGFAIFTTVFLVILVAVNALIWIR